MNQPFKLSTNFEIYSDPDFSLKAKHITDTIVLNIAIYPMPVPSVASIVALWNTFNTMLAKAENGSTLDTDNKNLARHNLEVQLKLLGNNYVIPIAGNDKIKIQQSGFDYTGGETTPKTQHPAPASFEVKPTTTQAVANLEQSAQEDTRVYMWQYIEVPTDGVIPPASAAWKYAFSTKAKITITGLTSEKAYFFKAASYAIEAAINWSNVVRYMVQ